MKDGYFDKSHTRVMMKCMDGPLKEQVITVSKYDHNIYELRTLNLSIKGEIGFYKIKTKKNDRDAYGVSLPMVKVFHLGSKTVDTFQCEWWPLEKQFQEKVSKMDGWIFLQGKY